MERKVGEVFDFDGIKLQVKYTGDSCFCCACYFYRFTYPCYGVRHINQIGECFRIRRTDDKNVIFVEVNNDKED